MAENERDFKGIWIPKDVWLDTRLNALDKIILAEIDSLDQTDRGCFASNRHIADFCQCSETKVSTAISKLIKYGYLRVQSFDGRQRELKSSLSNFERQTFKNCEADIQKLKESNTYNKTSNKTVIDYNAIIDCYNNTCVSLPKVKALSDSRKRAIRARLDAYSLDDIKTVFEKAEQSDFLSGRSGKWAATFDWLIKDSNFAKVIDGNYDNKKKYTRYGDGAKYEEICPSDSETEKQKRRAEWLEQLSKLGG